MARSGRKTLLVDCDLRRPSAHQLFEQTLQPGFSELVLGEVDLGSAMRPTTSEQNLWLLPAGQWDRAVVQELARNGVQDLFAQLRAEFDFVILDSHPLLPATDSLLIGQHVDGVIISVLHDVSQTPRCTPPASDWRRWASRVSAPSSTAPPAVIDRRVERIGGG